MFFIGPFRIVPRKDKPDSGIGSQFQETQRPLCLFNVELHPFALLIAMNLTNLRFIMDMNQSNDHAPLMPSRSSLLQSTPIAKWENESITSHTEDESSSCSLDDDTLDNTTIATEASSMDAFSKPERRTSLDRLPCKPIRVASKPSLKDKLPSKPYRVGSKPRLTKRDSRPKMPRRGASKTSMTRITSMLRAHSKQGGNPNGGNFVWDSNSKKSSSAPSTANQTGVLAASIRLSLLRDGSPGKLKRSNPTSLNRGSQQNTSIGGALSSFAKLRVKSKTQLG